MKLTKDNEGDRLLVRRTVFDGGLSTERGVHEVRVVEVTAKAVRLRWPNGAEEWKLHEDIVGWDLIESVDPGRTMKVED